MKSAEYRDIIALIVRKSVKKAYPGLNNKKNEQIIMDLSREAAKAIHARMYGANVDGVESPLWRKDEPVTTANEILERANTQ